MIVVGDLTPFLPALGSMLFLAVVSKVSHSEQRSLLLGLIGVLSTPGSPHVGLLVSAALSLVLRALDVLKVM